MYELLIGTTWTKFETFMELFTYAKTLGALRVVRIKEKLYIMKRA